MIATRQVNVIMATLLFASATWLADRVARDMAASDEIDNERIRAWCLRVVGAAVVVGASSFIVSRVVI